MDFYEEINKDEFFIFTMLVVTIIASSFFIYGQVYYFGFLNLDDLIYASDENFYDGLSLEEILSSWKSFENPYYMPFTHLSFLFEKGPKVPFFSPRAKTAIIRN